MSKQGKAPIPKATSNPDFEAVRIWYRMEFANYSFEVVRDVIQSILEKKLDHRPPEYYAMTVGAICIYARPFTNNKPVGKLADDIVPAKFKPLHDKIITMRHKLFAHSEATLAVGQDDYPHEAVIENDGKTMVMAVSRVAVIPDLLEQMKDLVDELITRTNFHRSKFAKKFTKPLQKLGKGEFRLNIADPAAPLFQKLSDAEMLVRKQKKSALDPRSTLKPWQQSKSLPMSQQVFYRAQRIQAPIANERGQVTPNYIIAVNTHDHEGNEYKDLKDRARNAFNQLPGTIVNDPVNLAEITEEDVPKEKLERVITLYDSVLFRVKND